MKLRVATLLILCAAVMGMSGGGRGDSAIAVGDDTPNGVSGPAADNVAAPGMVVHFDPATGRIVETPSAAALKELGAALAPEFNTSGEGLVEEPVKAPGGGVMIDLQGRFQNTTVATIDENGKLHAPCLPGSPSNGAGEGE